MASREIGLSVNSCRRIQDLPLAIANRAGCSAKDIIFAQAKRVLVLKCKENERVSLVQKAVNLDVDAFTRRTAMASSSSKERACLLFGLSFHAPFLDPRDQHLGVE
jgi:hypothetical protein